MSTKRSAKKCKVPTGRKPTSKQYATEWSLAFDLTDLQATDGLFRRKRGKAKDVLPPPHTWPPYGGKCWRQAYDEMIALQLLASTYAALEAAQRSGYMPASVLATYLAAYNAAKVQYIAAVGAMEDCLDLIV